MSEVSGGTQRDRRNYFRIEDDVFLEYRVVPADSLDAEGGYAQASARPDDLMSHLDVITQETNPLLKSIHEEHPEVAQYLAGLSRKMDLMAHTMLADKEGRAVRPHQRISLSAGGMAFDSDEGLQPGQVLQLKVIVSQSYLCVLTYGRVAYCRHEPQFSAEYPYHVGVEFLRLQDDEREALIRHVLTRQAANIRAQREHSQ